MLTTELILKLVEFLFIFLAKTPWAAKVVPILKSITDSILPNLLAKWVPAGLTPAQILDQLFAAIRAECKGLPNPVFVNFKIRH